MRELIAVGEEMEDAQWRLYDDGTIWFEGFGKLSGQNYRIYQDQIREIWIDGFFDSIAARQFQGLPELERVTFGWCLLDVESEAFRGCPKLRSVEIVNNKNIDIRPDAFADTPYDAELERKIRALPALDIPADILDELWEEEWEKECEKERKKSNGIW